MAYDEALAERIREMLAPREAVTERKMFGGIALHGRRQHGLRRIREDLMVRLGPEAHERRWPNRTSAPSTSGTADEGHGVRGPGRRRERRGPRRLGRRRRQARREPAAEIAGRAALGPIGRARRAMLDRERRASAAWRTQEGSRMDIALVHGSYHGAWCWDLLAPELERLGHNVITVDLPISDPTLGAADYAKIVWTRLLPAPSRCSSVTPWGAS